MMAAKRWAWRGALVVASAIALAGCDGQSAPNEAQASQGATDDASVSAQASAVTPWLKPEDIVKFPQSMIACLKREDLQAVTDLAMSGHKTQMLAFFNPKSDGGLRCIMLSPKKRFKVLDAEANDPNLPDALIVQVVGADIGSADHGAYALVMDKSMVETEGK